MPQPTPPATEGVNEVAYRRFLSRAELLTLFGMVLIFSSLFFAWERYSADAMQTAGLPALYKAKGLSITRTGFGTNAHWPLMICSVVSCLLLLWTPTPITRLPLALVQGACGLACLVIALTKLALLPGVLIGLIGGALLTWGALDRFSQPLLENSEKEAQTG